MEDTKKLAFIANMTDRALHHAASTPNIVAPDGKMSHEKMLSFVAKQTKEGLQHFAAGGVPLASAAPGNVNTTAGGLGGGIDNLLGTNNQFQATGSNIQQGTTAGQINDSYTQAQGALGAQGNITNALTPGVNQGATNQSNLAGMYADQAAGKGPNPAQAQLNQATGQNIAQQAALQAGQRGAGANAGLIASQAAQQGAATQQQAIGQSASLSAEQQLAAEQNLQNLSASQVAQGTQATQGLNNATQNEQNILQGANTSANNAAVTSQSNVNNVNASIASGNAASAGNGISGLLNGISSALPIAAALFAKGGVVGQSTSGPQSYVGNWLTSNTSSSAPSIASGSPAIQTSGADPFAGLSEMIGTPAEKNPIPDSGIANGYTEGSTVAPGTGPLLTSQGSAGGGYVPGSVVDAGSGPMTNVQAPMTFGGYYKGGTLMKDGGKVKPDGKNEKATVSGDSLKNDKIPAMLSQGELVIDRDTMNDPGPMGQMARALQQHIAKRNKR